MNGITIGGLASINSGWTNGIVLSSLANVIDGEARIVSVSGLATVCGGDLNGIALSGLANVTSGTIRGLTLSGLGTVGGDGIAGITLTGGAVLSEGGLRGITAGVIGTISSDTFEEEGLQFHGIQAESARWLTLHAIDVDITDDLKGYALGGIRVNAGEIVGVASSAGLVRARHLRGFSHALVNICDETQTGLTVGIVNFAEELHGVQIGLINIARNNRAGLRVLPIVNAHFE
jgi:hypothetical protein